MLPVTVKGKSKFICFTWFDVIELIIVTVLFMVCGKNATLKVSEILEIFFLLSVCVNRKGK